MEFELDMDFLKSLISDFDLMSILPDLVDVLDWIIKGVNLALIIGPVLLAVLGLWYLLLPTREANYVLGYRFFWGMGSVKAWKFTQRLAGLVWFILGSYMANQAYENRASLESLETLDMMYKIIELIIKQVSFVVLSILAINVVIFLIFNFKGNVRRPWRWIGRKIKEFFAGLKENSAKKKEEKKQQKKKAENN